MHELFCVAGCGPSQSSGLRVVRVLAAVLSLLVGIMYDKVRLQDGLYMSLFILVVAGAIFTVTVSTLKE